jgi:hypothetical protein
MLLYSWPRLSRAHLLDLVQRKFDPVGYERPINTPLRTEPDRPANVGNGKLLTDGIDVVRMLHSASNVDAIFDPTDRDPERLFISAL